LKHTVEFLLAALLLALSSPLLVLLALLVKVTSRGPVFYHQTRLGQDGKHFTLHKFRSMRHNCERQSGPTWSRPGDPRVTWLGRLLRVSHLDELPQLFNVLRGEMSLVGPHPERPEFLTELTRHVPRYALRLAVRPGITGLAQLQLPPDSDHEGVRKKVQLDLYYIDHGGFSLDVRILLCTVCKVLHIPFRISGRLLGIPGLLHVAQPSNEAPEPPSSWFEHDSSRSRLDPPHPNGGPHFGTPPAPAPCETDEGDPSISVIVPVRNEARFIRRTLRELLQQDYDPKRFEVVVVDGDSTDETCAIVRSLQLEYANLKLLHNPKRLSSAARNIGIRNSRGDLVVVVDGHCELNNPCYLRQLEKAFTSTGADCLGRPQPLEVAGANRVQQAIAVARASWLGHHPASFIYSSTEQFAPPQSIGVAYRRSVFERIGYFDESFDACEDVEFNHRLDRAGMSCYFTPKIQVYYHPRGTLRGLFRQMMRYGSGRGRLLAKHPSTFSLGSMVPAAFVLAIAVGSLLSWVNPTAAIAFVSVMALYAVLLLGTSLVYALRKSAPVLFLLMPLVYLFVHVGAGVGILKQLAASLPKRVTEVEPVQPHHARAERQAVRMNDSVV
jgi:succinoglycan biosynthesis protein ExoA